jgi:hypothetical protein
MATLIERIELVPFNAVATGIFFLAILHTFMAARFVVLAHRMRHRQEERQRAAGEPLRPSVAAEFLHFLGEVEVVFGLWALVLALSIELFYGWGTVVHYLDESVNYTEPLFVFVIMALASSRPIVLAAQAALSRVAWLGGGSPSAWWLAILTVGPLLGSFITEPAAMTICALLLGRQFYDLEPSRRLKYATLGLLFVNVSIGGTLTQFAAPPVLMVARTWGWDLLFMLTHFGWRAVIAIVASNVIYFAIFRREFRALAARPAAPDIDVPESVTEAAEGGQLFPVPVWLTVAHMLFMFWTVFNAHHSMLFIGGFLLFIGFVRATAPYQSEIDLKGPLLVAFFLAGLVIHGGVQGWWIAPLLASLSEDPLFYGAAFLTAFNDNALITYLATLVPELSELREIAVVEGAVAGGGLTVIANAPNPAGQSLLGRFFEGAIAPTGLLLGALIPTIVAVLAFRAIP